MRRLIIIVSILLLFLLVYYFFLDHYFHISGTSSQVSIITLLYIWFFFVLALLLAKYKSSPLSRDLPPSVRSLFYGLIFFSVLCFMIVPLYLGLRKKGMMSDGKIKVTVLQINDVYEIVPLEKGASGGLARVAYLRNQLEEENPHNVFTVVAGDFLSPSAIGTLGDSSEKIDGLQMVDVFNKVGVNLVTFGNHEFDLKKPQLQKCIDTSEFDWVSSNTFDSITPKYRGSFLKRKDKKAVPIPRYYIKEFTDADGTPLRIGLFGLTIRSSAGGYAGYDDYKEATREAIQNLKGKCDIIIALTHLDLEIDRQLAADFPDIKMIIGGHEHTNSYNLVGSTPIGKADANVKTVYVHTIEYNRSSKQVDISSELFTIDNSRKEDKNTRKAVDYWNERADTLLKKDFSPCSTVATLSTPFDGRESSIRFDTTNLTLAIGKAMLEATKSKHPVCAIYNSGAIRLDDMLKGEVTEYDIFRVLPYKDSIVVINMPGKWLDSILSVSSRNKGDGCFLQLNGSIKKNEKDEWKINDSIVIKKDSMTEYTVAMNGFLFLGKQDKMRFLKGKGKKIYSSDEVGPLCKDIRLAVMRYMEKQFKPASQSLKNKKIPCYLDY